MLLRRCSGTASTPQYRGNACCDTSAIAQGITLVTLIMFQDKAAKAEINMPYDIALGLAWDEMGILSPSSIYVVPLLTETYEVNIDSRTVLSMSSGIPADEGIAVLILHYLMGHPKAAGLQSQRRVDLFQGRGRNLFSACFPGVDHQAPGRMPRNRS